MKFTVVGLIFQLHHCLSTEPQTLAAVSCGKIAAYFRISDNVNNASFYEVILIVWLPMTAFHVTLYVYLSSLLQNQSNRSVLFNDTYAYSCLSYDHTFYSVTWFCQHKHLLCYLWFSEFLYFAFWFSATDLYMYNMCSASNNLFFAYYVCLLVIVMCWSTFIINILRDCCFTANLILKKKEEKNKKKHAYCLNGVQQKTDKK